MARVRFVVRDRDGIGKIARSAEMGAALTPLGEAVLAAAQGDPNEYYVSTLRMRRYTSKGRKGRMSIRVGAAQIIGMQVEAIRGTLSRSFGAAGL